MSEPVETEFFVGYLALPPQTKRFVLTVSALLVVLTLGIGALAARERDAPAATRQQNLVLVGRIDARSYGILWALIDDRAQPVLLARGGKFGAPDAVKGMDGKLAQLTGLLLERDGYRLMEVYKIEPAPTLTRRERALLSQAREQRVGTQTVRGEIVDSKCWLGRMKPGEGRTHRACAQLCISGGMPPVLVTNDERGTAHNYVLTNLSGAPIHREILPFVAEAVEVGGVVSTIGSMQLLRIDPAHIRRL